MANVVKSIKMQTITNIFQEVGRNIQVCLVSRYLECDVCLVVLW